MEVDQPEHLAGALSAPSAGPSPQAGHAGQDGEGEGTADGAGLQSASNGDKSKSKSKARDRTADKTKGKGKGKGRAKQGADEDSELSVLEKLALSPYSSELHVVHIAAAASDEEREEARAFMAQMVPLSEDLWLEWICDRKALVGHTLEGKVEVLELYKRACSDVLSIRLHQDYTHFVLAIYFQARGHPYPDVLEEEEMSRQEAATDESAAAVFDEEFVEGEMASAVDQTVRWHLPQGQSIWLVLHSYQLFQLRRSPSEDAISRMEQFYLERLCEPHLQLSDTFQLLSSFVSTYKNASYEESLVKSQPIYNATKAIVDLREAQEDQLATAHSSIEAYQAYLAWEQEVPKPNFLLVKVLYERALAAHPSNAELWHPLLTLSVTAVKKPQTFSGVTEAEWSADLLLEMYQRAICYLPFSGEVVSECIRGTESMCPPESALAFSEAQYERVIEANDTRLDMTGLVSIVVACADVVRHLDTNIDEGDQPSERLVSLLQGGIAKVKSLAPETGDPHLRVEKYLLRQYERKGDWIAIDALLASLAQSYPASALLLITRTEYILRQNKVDTVRKMFQNAAKKRYDYPEFVLDAWANFEHRDGSLATLEKALATITHEMTHIHARRLRESRLEQAAAAEAGEADSSMQQESEPQDTSKKRRLDQDTPIPATLAETTVESKPNAPGEDVQELKRDRENATISVTGLLKDAKEDDIKKMFRDCGPIREIKVRALEDQAVATVEFNTRESVPAALTKDKKRIDGQEVQVSPVWQSTLYITNFPEAFVAADLQRLFEPYGIIFETRWPSRRLKATRRFAYVQYVDSAAAQRALSLHNTVIEAGSQQRMQVRISDPSHRQTRTDANATKRELFVTGLHKQATESDLEKLFAPFGTLRGCRVLKDEAGVCKGAGFVDFETERSASAALSMNNHEYKKRRLGVVLADSRVSQKAKPTASGQGQRTDARNRTVNVSGLPSDAQEPLVQQFFDRFGRTTSVELDGTSATVIFEDPADASKLLLSASASKIEYDGAELTVKETSDRPQRRHQENKGASEGSSRVAGFLPRANRGRGRKLGLGAARHAQRMEVDTIAEPSNEEALVKSQALEAVDNTPAQRSQADFKALLLGKPKA